MRKFLTCLFILIPLISLFIFSNTYYSCASDQNLKNCSYTKKEIATVLNDFLPDVKILEINDAPIDGLCEIALESKSRKGIVYVDISKQYLISGSILKIKTKENLTQAKLTEINKVDVSQIPLDDALVMGDKEAKHRIIVFDDPD